jgi:uroporphyrinogen-III synthase
MKHVFISRELALQSELRSFCESEGIHLTSQPMIEFEAVESSIPDHDVDVVFFTSPRSIRFYFAQHPLPQGAQLAAIGDSTANALIDRGLHPNFVGKDSTDPDQTALDFAAWSGTRTVLIPQSDRSNKTIEKHLNSDKIIPLVVYKTVLKPLPINPFPDVLIFSSPSNAEAYFSANKFHSNQQVIAFGKTTAAYLKQTHAIPSLIPTDLKERTLVLMLTSIFSTR